MFVCLALERFVLVHGAALGLRHRDAPLRLLDDVAELVAEQLLTGSGIGRILSRREMHIIAARERSCTGRAGLGSLVNADCGEVLAEQGLHLAPRLAGERRAPMSVNMLVEV
jgi:hypothetical protein